MTAALRRIDSHLHLWDLAVSDYDWLGPDNGELFASFSPEQAEAELTGFGISGAVLVQAEDSIADTAYLLDVAARHDWVLGVVGWVPLDDPGATVVQLEKWEQSPEFCGVRHLVHTDPRDGFLGMESVRQSLLILAGRGLPIDVPDAWPRHLSDVTALAAALPGLPIVIDHLGKPPRGSDQLDAWRDELIRLAAHPNTVAKLSGLRVPGQPYTAEALAFVWDTALELFGAERLMWGGDWPMSVPDGGYGPTAAVLDELVAQLSVDEQRAILADTAIRTYRLWKSAKI